MASLTSIASLAQQAPPPLSERDEFLQGYAAYRSIVDGYEEAPRPSGDDVESVLSVVSSALQISEAQQFYSVESSVSGAGAWIGDADNSRWVTPLHWGGLDVVEGRSWYLRLSPGVMGLRCADQNKQERAQERAQEAKRRKADLVASQIRCESCPLFQLRPQAAGGSLGEIKEWSGRSRSRMSEKVGSLDYSDWEQSDGALAMVTLTLPSWWQAVAPDGKTFKVLLRKFEKRWRRGVGAWRLLWKLEFQRRGAPHWHALMRVPALVGSEIFEEWLSRTWAEVVNASKDADRCSVKTRQESSEYSRHLKAGTGVDFSGKDFSDPRRISLYFLGHSAKTTDGKEYQHVVPEEWREPGKGPGRFWGNPGLVSATREIHLTEHDAVIAARILRKVKKARAWTVAVMRTRGKLPVQDRKNLDVFKVELRQKEGQKRGRAAHRTYNKGLAAAAAERGEDFIWQKRFSPASLGGGGYNVGGWVLVNDALALGLDLARYFATVVHPITERTR